MYILYNVICQCVLTVREKLYNLTVSTIAGIISLAAGMAALLHLKVVRTSDGSKEDDTLLFSDVALGQAKARMQHALQSFLTGSINLC